MIPIKWIFVLCNWTLLSFCRGLFCCECDRWDASVLRFEASGLRCVADVLCFDASSLRFAAYPVSGTSE